MEIWEQNQQKINQNPNTTAQSVNAINNFHGRNRNANYNNLVETSLATQPSPKTTSIVAFALIVDNAGSHNHRQIRPANGNKCNNCGINGHFARKCRKPKKS